MKGLDHVYRLSAVMPPRSSSTEPPILSDYEQQIHLATIKLASKNYVIHESSQADSAVKPQWKDTMVAMFGDHVKWEELKVYASKGRPLCALISLTYLAYWLNFFIQPDRRRYALLLGYLRDMLTHEQLYHMPHSRHTAR